jgi:hypothetical protein
VEEVMPTLEEYLVQMGEKSGGKDITITYAPSTNSWHASVGGAFRASSKNDPIFAVSQAVAAFKEHCKRKQQRKTMKLDGPLEERCDHEGNTIEYLLGLRNHTMSPPQACEANRRMRCLEEGQSTLKEDEERWPKPKEDDHQYATRLPKKADT